MTTQPKHSPGAASHASRDVLVWLSVYVLIISLPLLALLPGALDATGRGFAWDLAMALGYGALAMFGVLFVLTARFRRATAPFGIDIVYYFHRYLAIFAVGVVVLHAGLVALDNPAALGNADPRLAPRHMTAGRVALLLFVALLVLSLARRVLRLRYEPWRLSHALLAVAGFALGLCHVLGAGHYLDTPWKRSLWLAYGALWLTIVAHVRVLRPWLIARAPWEVVGVRPERGQVWTLMLEPRGVPRLRFSPGQFAWLTLRASPFAMREHPFSIASSAARGERVELSIKVLGDFTATIKDVKRGETAWLDAPYGTFGIDGYAAAPGYVFIAGGIGMAPILSMLRTLADRGDRRPLWLFYGNRVWERVAFREELENLAQMLDLRVVHVLLEPPPQWPGEHGFIGEAVLARHLPEDPRVRAQLEYFLCGPTPMTAALEPALAALRVPARRIHAEVFDWV